MSWTNLRSTWHDRDGAEVASGSLMVYEPPHIEGEELAVQNGWIGFYIDCNSREGVRSMVKVLAWSCCISQLFIHGFDVIFYINT